MANTTNTTKNQERAIIDFAYEKENAFKRNSRAVYSEFEAGYEDKRVINWIVGNISIEEVNGKKMYAGKLATNTMYLGKKKGYSSRGSIAPIPFLYDAATKAIFPMSGETKERRQMLATHVARLMDKYLAGQTRINGAKDIEALKAVRGYNMLRLEGFKKFLKSYRGVTSSASFDNQAVADAIVAALPDMD